MRIIAGEHRGRVLQGPRSQSFRPTTDRVKESLFNILSNLLDWETTRVCDLFSGSGNLGLEALSRGAPVVCFVENDRHSVTVLRNNIALLGVADRCTIHARTVESFLLDSALKFDLVLVDPPYSYGDITALLASITTIAKNGAICTVEHSGRDHIPAGQAWSAVQARAFGTTGITILRRAEAL